MSQSESLEVLNLITAKSQIATLRRQEMPYALMAFYHRHTLDRVIVVPSPEHIIAKFVLTSDKPDKSLWVAHGRSASSLLWWLMRYEKRAETDLIARLTRGDIGALRANKSGVYCLGPYPN